MARIRSRGTLPERTIRSALSRRGVRFRAHDALLPGRPDFVLPGSRVAIFVDGCFWHGCPDHYNRPKTRQEYWDRKLRLNIARRTKVARELRALGWTAVAIWECEARGPSRAWEGRVFGRNPPPPRVRHASSSDRVK